MNVIKLSLSSFNSHNHKCKKYLCVRSSNVIRYKITSSLRHIKRLTVLALFIMVVIVTCHRLREWLTTHTIPLREGAALKEREIKTFTDNNITQLGNKRQVLSNKFNAIRMLIIPSCDLEIRQPMDREQQKTEYLLFLEGKSKKRDSVLQVY